jgi:hypothetical protein
VRRRDSVRAPLSFARVSVCMYALPPGGGGAKEARTCAGRGRERAPIDAPDRPAGVNNVSGASRNELFCETRVRKEEERRIKWQTHCNPLKHTERDAFLCFCGAHEAMYRGGGRTALIECAVWEVR